jgi:hypothetical protein
MGGPMDEAAQFGSRVAANGGSTRMNQRFFLYRNVAKPNASMNQMAYRIKMSPVVMSHPSKTIGVLRLFFRSRRGILRPPWIFVMAVV